MACVVRHGPSGTAPRLTTNGVGADDWLGGLGAGAVWFDTTVRRLPVGSPRTGWGRRLARRLGCCGLCGSTRPSEDSRSAHHERGGADDWLGGLGAGGCVVRHDRPKTPGRLTTNGVGPTIGSEAWVLRAVWFDTGTTPVDRLRTRLVRRLPVGSPRTG